ncbi:YciI family protein [Roseateles amylovorans]|uniref:YciI family protein n=1 Tax=Roseateles amylovorans TaxID=2978473 RepID=A0ABY6AZA1_9BURK|nr:YciI family protein [Roseateles amylovorans]UXH78017.1 YciI family protein [Roseateles amylovorans]
MRYMLIIKASEPVEPTESAQPGGTPAAPLDPELAAFRDDMARAGVLLERMDLRPSRDGWRISIDAAGHRQIVPGPFTAPQAQALIAAYLLIQVRSPEEALEWARRCPTPQVTGPAAEIELRRVQEIESLAPTGPILHGHEVGLCD